MQKIKTERRLDIMKFVEIKGNLQTGAENAWDFVKEHKVEIGLTIVTTVSGIGLLILGKKLYSIDTKHRSFKEFKNVPSFTDVLPEFIRKIDEEIFTDLAPEIENLVICDRIENAIVERSFTLEPTLHKLVTVKIDAIHGD